MSDINIFGCFVKTTVDSGLNNEEQNLIFEQGKLFRTYIWGEKGINEKLKRLEHSNYGKDLILILFQFYVNPLQDLKDLESYRKNEKSIGIPIIVTDENFFSKSEEGRYSFLKQSVLQKLDLLAEVVKKKKLDTKMDLLKADLQKLLS